MRDIDKRAVEAAGNPDALDRFLLEHETYILKCASRTAKRYINKSDDEWAIAIEAFYQAVQQYSYKKGSFLGFARMMISRRLIDYFRAQSRFRAEIPVSPAVLSGELEDEEEEAAPVKLAVPTEDARENTLKDEIEAANAQFAAYGFSFYDLIECSPKAKKTREACRAAVDYMVSSPILCCEMQRLKELPLKMIEKNAKIPRKILERHRKYIIAASELSVGDYPGLSEYIRPRREGSYR
jgi:RNA polymerase sigma factor